MHMKKTILLLAFFAIGFGAMAQSVSESTIQKRENRKGMVLKEWNTAAGDKRAFLDRVTTYDKYGRKIEEIEYASYGQKWRVVSEYPANSDITAKVVREIEYNDRDKATTFPLSSSTKSTRAFRAKWRLKSEASCARWDSCCNSSPSPTCPRWPAKPSTITSYTKTTKANARNRTFACWIPLSASAKSPRCSAMTKSLPRP